MIMRADGTIAVTVPVRRRSRNGWGSWDVHCHHVVCVGDHIHFGDVKRVGLAQLTIMIVQGQLHICDSLFIQLDQSHVTDLALDLYTTRSVAHTVQAYAQRR